MHLVSAICRVSAKTMAWGRNRSFSRLQNSPPIASTSIALELVTQTDLHGQIRDSTCRSEAGYYASGTDSDQWIWPPSVVVRDQRSHWMWLEPPCIIGEVSFLDRGLSLRIPVSLLLALTVRKAQFSILTCKLIAVFASFAKAVEVAFL
jgi:hypothetical protein